MALSTPPPPPDPTTTTTSTTTTTRPPFPANPRHPPPQPHPPPHHYPPPYYLPHPQLINSRHPSNPNHNNPNHPTSTTTNASTTTLYPVASSGRGFLPSHPHSYPHHHSRPGIGVSYPRPVFGYPHHPDPGSIPGFGYVTGSNRPVPHLQQQQPVMPGVIKGVPVSASPSSHPQPKIAPLSASVSDCNGHKEARERGKDDSFVIIRDRKVRVSENASVYALCRSWLRNGVPEECQPVNMDAARSLPRPLPLPAQDNLSPVKKDDPKEEEEEGSVDNLTSQELLQRHIKRAKRVRSRLREERLQRIARYKTRLALLLPLMVEQQMRNDSASGN